MNFFIKNKQSDNYNYKYTSTEYEKNPLINDNLDKYFNNLLLTKPNNEIPIVKSCYTFEKFYLDYIEHNLIFIVVLIGIIIFLFIRYHVKDFDEQSTSSKIKDTFSNTKKKLNSNTDDSNTDDSNDYNTYKNKQNKSINKQNKNNFKKIQIEKLKLIEYKKKLDNEKKQILSIIDELSNINEYDNIKKTTQPNYFKQNMKLSYNNTQQPITTHNDNDVEDFQYYNLDNNLNNELNKISGLYIEPPFM